MYYNDNICSNQFQYWQICDMNSNNKSFISKINSNIWSVAYQQTKVDFCVFGWKIISYEKFEKYKFLKCNISMYMYRYKNFPRYTKSYDLNQMFLISYTKNHFFNKRYKIWNKYHEYYIQHFEINP